MEPSRAAPPPSEARILLVVPSYRESARLGGFLRPLAARLTDLGLPVRVRVVDDGSGAEEAGRTAGLVGELAARYPLLAGPLLLPRNLGKGGAVYAGWREEPRAEWLAFADADGATSPGEIGRVLAMVLGQPEAADAWLASRVKMLGRAVDRTWKRHVFGRVYATFASLFTGIAVYDSQCGFKVVRRAAFARIEPFLRESRFGFDMELIARLHRAGARIVEVPVDWEDVPGSKVRLVRDGAGMFRSLLRLRRSLAAAPAEESRG